LVILLLVSSCNPKGEQNNYVCKIDSLTINSKELDFVIKQELFDELNRIYDIKLKALDALIDYKLLEREALKNNTNYENFIECYSENIICNLGMDSLKKKYNNTEYITHIRGNSLYNVHVDSMEGQYYLSNIVKKYLIMNLVDSLKNEAKIVKFIYPPSNPYFNLKDIKVYYRGNLNSQVSVIIVSDFDCDKCIKYKTLYDSIYYEYKDKVKFGHVNFSAIPTLSQLAAEAANQQGHFWEYYDSLYNYNGFVDSITVYKIANNLKLDMKQFRMDFESEKIRNDFDLMNEKLANKGLYATPTIIINNRLLFNSIYKEEIVNLVERELLNY